METFYIINQIPKINRAHWNLPWMSCILKFRSLKISLETLERSFHRGEKTEISREASWNIWNSPLSSALYYLWAWHRLPHDLIDATESFGSALANRFLTLGLFCFCPPTMWWCRCAHTARQGSEPVWSFRYHSGNNYDLMTGLTILLGAGEFTPYEPRSFAVVSELKATGLPLCFIVSLFSRFVTFVWS